MQGKFHGVGRGNAQVREGERKRGALMGISHCNGEVMSLESSTKQIITFFIYIFL